jgi:hypothetical protein
MLIDFLQCSYYRWNAIAKFAAEVVLTASSPLPFEDLLVKVGPTSSLFTLGNKKLARARSGK